MNTLVLAAVLAVTNNLGTVVVEASRLGETLKNLPQNVQVITREEIAQSGARDVADLLSKAAPSVTLNRLGGDNPALTQISMGGYGENGFGRVLVMVDGERLNSPDMNAPNLAQISLTAVKQIEILSGPQTVLHGDGASAGMINIVTEPTDYARHGAVEAHVGSWGTAGASMAIRGGVEEDGVLYWASGAYDRSDGYRDHSAFDIYNANGGVRKNFLNGSFLRVSAFYNDSDYDLPGYLSRAQWRDDPRASTATDDFYRRTTYGLRATLSTQLNDENAIRVTGAASHRRMKSRTYGYWDVNYEIYSYEVTPEWINTSDVFGLKNEFIAGATFRYDRNDAKTPLAYGGASGRLSRPTMAFFAQDTLHLTDALAVQLGGRYERLWMRDDRKGVYNVPTSRTSDPYAYDVAILFRPVDDLKTYIRFSRFFRAPFLDEHDGKGEMLRPETGYRADVGADWAFLDEFELGGDFYASRLKDEIFYNPFVGWGTNMNASDDTLREGLNLRVGWAREKVAGLRLAYSFVRAEFDGGEYDGKRIPLVPEQTLSLTARVYLWDDCFVFGGYRYQTAQWAASDFRNTGAYAASRKEGRIPNFGLFHIGAEYAPSFAAWIDGFKIGFTIDNLFDKKYCDYATYGTAFYPGTGRRYMFTVRYEF